MRWALLCWSAFLISFFSISKSLHAEGVFGGGNLGREADSAASASTDEDEAEDSKDRVEGKDTKEQEQAKNEEDKNKYVSKGPPGKNASILERFQYRLERPNRDEGRARLVMLEALDYTNAGLGSRVREIATRGIARFGKLEPENSSHTMEALDLNAFRSAVIQTDADVAVLLVLKPALFEIYLYDRQTPYGVYAYAQQLADPAIHQYSRKVVVQAVKKMIARLIQSYVSKSTLRLPRRDLSALAYEGDLSPTNIPRSATTDSLVLAANSDRKSRFYASGAYGYLLTRGVEGRAFNSSVLAGSFGARLGGKWYGEVTLQMSSYNFGILSLQRLSEKRDSAWRYLWGVGLGYATARYTINWDQTNDIGFSSFYLIPSFTVMLPLGTRAYVSAQTRLYAGLQFQRFLFSFIPGLFVRF